MPSPNKSGLSVISILSELPTIIAGIYTSIHTSSSLLYSVVRSIPSSSVVTFHFLFACFKVRKILSLFSASLRRAKLTDEVALVMVSYRCSFVTRSVCTCNTASIMSYCARHGFATLTPSRCILVESISRVLRHTKLSLHRKISRTFTIRNLTKRQSKSLIQRHCPRFCVNRKLEDSSFILESCFQSML